MTIEDKRVHIWGATLTAADSERPPLAVQSGGVVDGEVDLQYHPQRDDRRVESNPYDLRMIGGPGTDVQTCS